MDTVGQDLRYAFRQLRRSPGFALTAVLTLALGIGVNAAMFSVIEQVILRPLPYPNGSRMVAVEELNQHSQHGASISLPDLRDYQARSHSLQALGYYTIQLPTLGGTENPEVVPQLVVNSALFDVLGVRPALGRGFTATDDKGDHHVLILSDQAWRKFYHADASIVGRSVPINGDPWTIIGVLPPGVRFPIGAEEEFFSPLNIEDKNLQDRGSGVLQPVALLRPGVTPALAQAELNSIHQQLLHEYANERVGNEIRVTDYHASITQHSRSAIFALDWAVLAVWLIACANVAGLMLTRTNARRREIAIRGALGAQRARITRQFLTESLLIALAGSAAGLGIAVLALRLLRQFLASTLLFGADIHVNAGVLAFLLLASCISALIFGLVPAWHAASVPAQEGLRDNSAAAGTSRRQALWRDSLVVTEITLTLALLIAAGLMMRTLLSLRHADMGFVAENVVTASLYLPGHGPWWSPAAGSSAPANMIHTFYDPLAEKLAHTPGVEAIGFSTVRPLLPQWDFDDDLVIRNHPLAANQHVHAEVRATTTGFYSAMGIRLIAGRFFGDQDGATAPIAILVNRELVREAFPAQNPIGQQLEVGSKGPREWGVIVGVIDDTRQSSPGQPAGPEMNIDLEQLTPSDDFYPILGTFHMDIAVRTHLPTGVIGDTLRHDVHDLRPEVAVQDIQTMEQVMDDALGGQTLAARLLGIFGLAALLIAVAGIYGLLAYSVSQRTRELGVRIALGAGRGDILWLVLRHALLLLAVGMAIGLGVAWAAGGVLRSFLYGLSGYDAATVVLVVLALGLCGLAASYLPARRAAGIDPIEALRTE